MVPLSLNTEVALLDISALPAAFWIGSRGTHFIPQHANIFSSLLFAVVLERVPVNLRKAAFRLRGEGEFRH